MPVLGYDPVPCKHCGGILNPYCSVDYAGKIWVCPFCFQRNQFPPNYAGISEQNVPGELIPSYTTVEYALSSPAAAPVYLWVVDTCLSEKELHNLKATLSSSLSLLPQNAKIGFISFGSTVQVYELGFTGLTKSYVFRGEREWTTAQVAELLGLKNTPGNNGNANGAPNQSHRFIVPLSECESVLDAVLESLQVDPWPVKPELRPNRVTGAALNIATALMEASFSNMPGRISLFLGGPCTSGVGMVVEPPRKETMRGHSDIVKGNAPHMAKATKFYGAIAQRAASAGHGVDILACALDQCGIMEMREVAERTGGLVLISDAFNTPIFKKTLAKMFASAENGDYPEHLAFSGTLNVKCSRDIKVRGLIGPASVIVNKSNYVSDQPIGLGGTSSWRMCTLDDQTTLATYYEVSTAGSGEAAAAAAQSTSNTQRYLQFQTHYLHPSGVWRLRVTSCGFYLVENNLPALTSGFDQECAAVLMARLAAWRAISEDTFNILRWLDRLLIRLAARFGEYRAGDPSSFSFNAAFAYFPQFMFHLRRSRFLQVFNFSPDETAWARCMLNRENVANALVMIQPTLLRWKWGEPVQAVVLDVSAVDENSILLLDSFFTVVVFHGNNIAQWRKENYQEKEGYEAFRDMLDEPQVTALELMRSRFPLPHYVDVDQGGSQARFLTAKLNPSITHNSVAPNQSEVIFTDDVSLEVFLDHLRKLAVQGVN